MLYFICFCDVKPTACEVSNQLNMFYSPYSNVSKYNYAFSDFPFPESTVEYPHHSTMAEYIDKYVEHFELYNHIQYRTRVLEVIRTG